MNTIFVQKTNKKFFHSNNNKITDNTSSNFCNKKLL